MHTYPINSQILLVLSPQYFSKLLATFAFIKASLFHPTLSYNNYFLSGPLIPSPSTEHHFNQMSFFKLKYNYSTSLLKTQ